MATHRHLFFIVEGPNRTRGIVFQKDMGSMAGFSETIDPNLLKLIARDYLLRGSRLLFRDVRVDGFKITDWEIVEGVRDEIR